MIYLSIPPACYTETSWFQREREKLFREHWILIAMTQQFPEENSFVTREVGGVPVLVQKMEGRLRAFKNACPHRACPIQTEPFGNRKLICPYHGWNFGKEGQLRGIPLAEGYNFSEADKTCMDLQTYPLEIVGKFVFVNLSGNPKPITTQFSEDILLLLRETSSCLSTEFSYTIFTGKYNWKLNFENVIEEQGQHIPFVHQNTLSSILKKEGENVSPNHFFCENGPLAAIRQRYDSGLFASISTGDDKSTDIQRVSFFQRAKMPWRKQWFSSMMNSRDRGWCFTIHIFPNVNLFSSSGECCVLQQYVPLAPDSTEYHSWTFSAPLKDGIRPMPHLLWGFHHAEKRILNEDIAIFEQVQKVLASRPESAGYLGKNERSLATFGRYYLQCLNKEENHE
ncbi:MAG: aromatic ring-hydroxylating dioxygenase subunit alpha [Zoogloeaceae bacterium]|jgi:phenylpropionate dioxygenase-like ring-hydroxylating dioxygenase large terminal subunit|nr:aromatic ring-hydroxylating dioxygenase subunit alpha [Zoogloeaceae bacterium]